LHGGVQCNPQVMQSLEDHSVFSQVRVHKCLSTILTLWVGWFKRCRANGRRQVSLGMGNYLGGHNVVFLNKSRWGSCIYC